MSKIGVSGVSVDVRADDDPDADLGPQAPSGILPQGSREDIPGDPPTTPILHAPDSAPTLRVLGSSPAPTASYPGDVDWDWEGVPR